MQHTILIIDDDADIRAVVRRTLTAQGYRTIESSDGIAAYLLARRDPPALIVLDLGLPGQDGWDVARQVRADPRLEKVPILVITGYSSGPARNAARDAGCQYVLQKPFTLTALEDITTALLATQN